MFCPDTTYAEKGCRMELRLYLTDPANLFSLTLPVDICFSLA